MLCNINQITMSSALGYFYTASEECLPGGPNFSYTFYITVAGIIGSVVDFLAVIFYQNFLSSWRFRPVLIFTILVGALAPVVDLIIVLRWNVAIGIPDRWFFLLGSAIFEAPMIMLQNIPFSAIYAKIAPPGLESAVFSYSVGVAFFCSITSGLIASGVIQWSGMKTIGDSADESCDFEALPYLVVIFQICIPMIIGIPATFLIPVSSIRLTCTS